MNWDFYGRTDSIELYEEQVLEEVIGLPTDFEILRFSHKEDSVDFQTKIKYDFYFFDNQNDILTATNNDWEIDYRKEGFSATDIYYYTRPFTNSFFKLDFYDTNDTKTQTNYFTLIVPVQQGGLISDVAISPYPPLDKVKIKKPSFVLDYVGDKEGFFIYWLRKTKFLDIKTFYMSAKFFDARLGVFIRMMNTPQPSLPNKFSFDEKLYFYYKVNLNYEEKTYEVLNSQNVRVGSNTATSPIKWYEYVNKP